MHLDWFFSIQQKIQGCLINNYTFQLGFDNYLEYVEIIINYGYYDEKLINKILEHEYKLKW